MEMWGGKDTVLCRFFIGICCGKFGNEEIFCSQLLALCHDEFYEGSLCELSGGGQPNSNTSTQTVSKCSWGQLFR